MGGAGDRLMPVYPLEWVSLDRIDFIEEQPQFPNVLPIS